MLNRENIMALIADFLEDQLPETVVEDIEDHVNEAIYRVEGAVAEAVADLIVRSIKSATGKNPDEPDEPDELEEPEVPDEPDTPVEPIPPTPDAPEVPEEPEEPTQPPAPPSGRQPSWKQVVRCPPA